MTILERLLLHTLSDNVPEDEDMDRVHSRILLRRSSKPRHLVYIQLVSANLTLEWDMNIQKSEGVM